MAFLRNRFRRIGIFFFLLFLCLGIRVGYLQAWQIELAEQSVEAHRECVPYRYVRGEIYDRYSRLITNRSEEDQIAVLPSMIEESEEQVLELLMQLSGLSSGTIEAYQRAKETFLLPYCHQENRVETAQGIVSVRVPIRYSEESYAAHLLGYTKEADRIGISGIEKLCDAILRSDEMQYFSFIKDAKHDVIADLGYRRSEGETSSRVLPRDW